MASVTLIRQFVDAWHMCPAELTLNNPVTCMHSKSLPPRSALPKHPVHGAGRGWLPSLHGAEAQRMPYAPNPRPSTLNPKT